MTRMIVKHLAAGALLALGALTAQAQSAPPMHGPESGHDGHGMMHGPQGGHDMMMRKMQHFEEMLKAVDATPEQRKQIHAILMAAHKDGKSQMDAGRKLHEQGIALFTAPTVDAAAIEGLRQQDMAMRDAASKSRMQVMIDIAKVLNAEQRGKIAAIMKMDHERMAERMKHMKKPMEQHAPWHPHPAASSASK